MLLKYKDLEKGELVRFENALTYNGSRLTGEGRIEGFATTLDGRPIVWVDIGNGYKSFLYEDIIKVAPHGDVSHVAG